MDYSSIYVTRIRELCKKRGIAILPKEKQHGFIEHIFKDNVDGGLL